MTRTQPDEHPDPAIADPQSLSPDDLGPALLAHLAREAAALEEAAALHRDLNGALRAADADAVEAAGARLAAHGRGAARRERAALLQAAARALGLEGEVTLRAIIARLPASSASALEQARDRACRLGLAVAALGRRNAALAGHGLAFVQERLDALTGAVPLGRYGADGRAVAPRRLPLLQARG